MSQDHLHTSFSKFLFWKMIIPIGLILVACRHERYASVSTKIARVKYDLRNVKILFDTGKLENPVMLWDPFGHSYNLVQNGNDAIIYSCGPDLVDNKALIMYDPTNGTNSAGDIIVKLTTGTLPGKHSLYPGNTRER